MGVRTSMAAADSWAAFASAPALAMCSASIFAAASWAAFASASALATCSASIFAAASWCALSLASASATCIASMASAAALAASGAGACAASPRCSVRIRRREGPSMLIRAASFACLGRGPAATIAAERRVRSGYTVFIVAMRRGSERTEWEGGTQSLVLQTLKERMKSSAQ
jgi:hypothetical protein